MAHKKGQGSSNNGRESQSKRLGVKLFGGEYAIPGNIIVRQRGTKFHPGSGVGIGKDHTIFAKEAGTVSFSTSKNNRKYISVLPADFTEEPTTVTTKKEAKKAAPKKEATEKVEKEAPKAEKQEAKAEKAPAKKSTKKGDDLKKISGVGPAFEKRLNALGIHTYDDMIALTDDKIAELEEQDAMTSIEQWHDWMKQAAELKG